MVRICSWWRVEGYVEGVVWVGGWVVLVGGGWVRVGGCWVGAGWGLVVGGQWW